MTTNSALGFELQEKLASLEAAILEKDPRMPTLLQEIHRALKAQPENVTLLSEEEIQIIVSGLKVQTGVALVKSTVKAASSTQSIKAKLKALGADAI